MSASSPVGLHGPEYVMDIERGKLREFARAVYADVPAYVDGEHPVIHPTFLTTAGIFWGYTLERPRGTAFEQIDHDLSVPLHAEEAYRFVGPLPTAGQRLIARSTLESLSTKRGARGGELAFLVLLTEFWDAASREPVAQARSTTVTTERQPRNAEWGSTVPPYVPRYAALEPYPDPFREVGAQSWDQLEEGTGPGRIEAGPLTLRDIVRYQGACGEDNPLHYDLAHARAQGFPGLFSIGMQQAGGLASYAARWLGPARVRSFRTRFRSMVWAGESLSYEGRIERKYEHQGQRLVDVELRCLRAPEDVVVQAWMTFGAHT